MPYIFKYQHNMLFNKNMTSVFITLPLSKWHPPSQFLLPITIRLKNRVNQHFYNIIQHFGLTKLFVRLLVLYSILETRKMTKSIKFICAQQIKKEKFLELIFIKHY